MANKNSSGLIVLSSILGAALVGTVVYLLVKNKSNPTDTANALANVQAAKNNLANLKSNPSTSASQIAASNAALQAAQAALKKLQSSAKSSGSGGGSGSGSGGGASSGGSARRSAAKPPVDQLVPVNANGDYIEKADPTTLYNNDGSVKGDLDTNSGMFVDQNGKIVAAGDGSSVINSDPNTGAYQEADGTWYLNDGTALMNYDPTNNTYTEADGSIYGMGGNYLGDVTDTSAPVDAGTGGGGALVDTTAYTDAPIYDYSTDPSYGYNFSGAGTKHFAGFVGAGTLFK